MSGERYEVLTVDPPWSYGGKAAEARTARYATQLAGHQYAVIGAASGGEVNRRTGAGIDSIAAAFPAADYAADRSAMLLWTTNPKLPFAFDLLRMWGFTYQTTLTWLKTAASGQPLRGGLGWYFRGATEHVLFGTRGGYGIPPALRQPNYFHGVRGRHSAKPAEFYEVIEAATPGQSRLEVFARDRRPGWDAWGDQVPAAADPGFGRHRAARRAERGA